METRKSPVRRIVFSAVVTVLALSLVPASLAAKGGNGGGGNTTPTATLELVMTDSGLAGAATSGPHYGDTVKFQGTTTSSPNVELVCSQNGKVAYASLSGWYETTFADGSYTTRNMTLSSQAWTGGAATCTATLYHISGLKTVTDATLAVNVSA